MTANRPMLVFTAEGAEGADKAAAFFGVKLCRLRRICREAGLWRPM